MVKSNQILNNMEFYAQNGNLHPFKNDTEEISKSVSNENIFSEKTILHENNLISSLDLNKTYIYGEEDSALESFKDLWQIFLNHCHENMNEVSYNCWVSLMEPISFSSGEVTAFVKNDFQKKIIMENFHPFLKESFEKICGFPVKFTLISGEETESGKLNEERVISSRSNTFSDISKTHYDYTFENFIVGPSNKFTHAAAVAVAENPGNAYNPLFIYGNSGLGKTHLLNAICYKIRENNPNAVIIFTTGEDFTNEFIGHLRHNTTNVFHDKYRNADVLLVDDVQFIGGKEQTEEEFFHTFNALHQNNRQIVLTADKPPKEMPILEDRVSSRFEWGLLADIQAPDFETRIAIIKRKAELLNLSLSDNLVHFIAEKIKKNIRQLESVVRKLNAYYLLDNIPPTIQVAQNAIKDVTSDNKPVGTTVSQIISEVSRTMGVPENKITSKDKTAKVSQARQISMYIIREMTGISMKDIGSYFEGRDYSTAIYAINQIKNKLQKDSSLSNLIEGIIKNVSEE